MTRVNGKGLNYTWGVGAEHALYRDDGKWYHHLKNFPGALFDRNGYVLFSTVEEYKSSPYLQHGHDLHVPQGISEIPDYIKVLGNNDKDSMTFDVNNVVVSLKRQVAIRVRNRLLVEKIKQIYDNTCQICGLKMRIRENRYYSEVHHLIPLGEPHFGPDVLENMICVCPNHHVLLDLGGIPLEADSIFIAPQHAVNFAYLKYHNQNIFGKL
ncbi:hypothetical protein HPY28_19260 [Brevibacillus sp. HB1.2]|uniref:HNH endonuclease n=1 Tax=Brevibacillus sp. HB1.2 TaxID=2738807 RepID=UPI001576210E|nr:HNH endonuclease [Brevibacillus sp. HB1.2]NTU22464.1 hypothetical protein [Brevibacillus sp. HB1.2]